MNVLAATFIAVTALVLSACSADVGSPSASENAAATPTSTSDVLASGSFTAPLDDFGEEFDIEATGTGDDVSGTLDVTAADGAYSVDLQCARTTEEGRLVIGGKVSQSTSEFIAEDVFVAMLLAPGTPIGALWAADVLPTDEVPSPADSCSGFVDTLVSDSDSLFSNADASILRPVTGDLEINP